MFLHSVAQALCLTIWCCIHNWPLVTSSLKRSGCQALKLNLPSSQQTLSRYFLFNQSCFPIYIELIDFFNIFTHNSKLLGS